MRIRCGDCHETIWVQPARADGDPGSVTCEHCGREFRLRGRGRNGSSDDALAKAARRLAKDESVDLPGAYSVLLGIMTLEELRELSEPGSTACRTGPTEDRGRHRYDRAFQPAIDAGQLTPRQAAERGNRDVYAGILASRHGLPKPVALDIADNKISLLEAIRERGPRPSGGAALPAPAPRCRRGRTALMLAVLVALLVAVGLLSDHGVGPVRLDGEAGRVHGAEFVATDDGVVLSVSAPDPHTVLRGYCAASPNGRLEPLDVVPSARLGSGARLGLMRDVRRPDHLLAITIREDRATDRWRAGDGSTRLVPRLAPEEAMQAVRSP